MRLVPVCDFDAHVPADRLADDRQLSLVDRHHNALLHQILASLLQALHFLLVALRTALAVEQDHLLQDVVAVQDRLLLLHPLLDLRQLVVDFLDLLDEGAVVVDDGLDELVLDVD